jgi:hypothetical protein
MWNCIVQLSLPDTFAVANGCTLLFDPRYDTECKYDYFYVDFWNDSTWVTLAAFNATSNNPGSECGLASGGNPDYWGNTDTDNLLNCDWQERPDPSVPAFYRVLTPDTLGLNAGPKFRWRFLTDTAWSDADGRGDTDGGAWIDNVMVWGENERYVEGFESGTLDTSCWDLPDPEGVADAWHIVHDPDDPYEGGDGGAPTTCYLDSSFVYRARPECGFPGAASWRNQWYYRLMTPAVPMLNNGVVVQCDQYVCTYDYTCDWFRTMVRFYDQGHDRWCPWDYDPWILLYKTCDAGYRVDVTDDMSEYATPAPDSVQFSWNIFDTSQPGDFCYGKHKKTDVQIDNVSIGFYDASASRIVARGIDLFHDTFHTGLCGYNSAFDANDPDTVSLYWGGLEPPWENQLVVTVSDFSGITSVELEATIDAGSSWITKSMVLRDVCEYCDMFTGDYSGTVWAADFGDTAWAVGTEVWYCVKATDGLAEVTYFPAAADPASPNHTGFAADYLTFSVLPTYPVTYTGPRILLVNGYGRKTHDWSPCLGSLELVRDLGDIYGRTLEDAGYCYDIFDIHGAGSNVHIHPVAFDDYDAVVWFTGPHFQSYLFDREAMEGLLSYLDTGGKAVFCGDRIGAAFEWVIEPDSVEWVFKYGVLGFDYSEEEMPHAFDYPYVQAVGEASVDVFGNPIPVDLDTLLVYRGCPALKDMPFILTRQNPPAGHTAQPLMYVANPTGGVTEADIAIYTEHQQVGQSVFVSFDLCASVNHERSFCTGAADDPAPDFNPGHYEGRVELILVILEDLFGLPPGSGGHAASDGSEAHFRWRLCQSVPNPCVTSTSIRYEVAYPGNVTIEVYNALGRLVRVIDDGFREPGVYYARWDGCNSGRRRVASGVYFYRMTAGPFTATRKMLLIR